MKTERERIGRIVGWYLRHGRNSDEVRNFLVKHFLHIAQQTAATAKARLGKPVDLNILKSHAFLGLIAAIEGFDPAEGAPIDYYCRQRCNGAILDGLRKEDPATRGMRGKSKKITRATETLLQRNSRNPSPEEVAEELGLSQKEYKEHSSAARALVMKSISPSWAHDHATANPAPAPQFADRSAPDPARPAHHAAILDMVLRDLSRRDRLIIVLLHGEKLTMAEVANALGYSEARICQLHVGIIQRLQARLKTP